jgi:hypothetical protein
MTFIELEEAPANETETLPADNQMVKCGWCGEIIRLDADELALAMCQTCFNQMLAEFLRSRQAQTDEHASER